MLGRKQSFLANPSTYYIRFELSPFDYTIKPISDSLLGLFMLRDGEFDINIRSDGIEVWVTKMGDFMNMNTAIIDRTNKVVAIIDPFDSERWFSVLKSEDLCPTHLLYTHTHRDHTWGYKKMLELVPDIQVFGHEDADMSDFVHGELFGKVDFTHKWDNAPNSTIEWSEGGIILKVTHSPGHAPGHVTFHGHGIYHAGDLLFTAYSGRVDLPGSDPSAQISSLKNARKILSSLPEDWRLIPGHRYEWIDGTTPDWVTIKEILENNFSLNDKSVTSSFS